MTGPGVAHPGPPGRHRRTARWPVAGLAALTVCLGATAALLILPAPGTRPPDGPLTVARAWPQARLVTSPGRLADGTSYTPLHHLDGRTSVGTAPTADGATVRLLLRTATGEPRELRRQPQSGTPQFGGFAATGDDLVWAESTTSPDGRGETKLWRHSWRSPQASPVPITAELGDAVFFNSQYDVVIAEGRVRWVAAARSSDPVTEVRSVPLSGGQVEVRRLSGAFALAGWPWLVSAGASQATPVELHNLADGRRISVESTPRELVTCGSAWCRVLVLAGAGGSARIELMRPDGSQRQTVATGLVSSSISDVAVLDRFEVLTQASADGAATASQRLLLFDARRQRTVVVAEGAGMVLCRAGLLWWSTTGPDGSTWHTLDLRSLD